MAGLGCGLQAPLMQDTRAARDPWEGVAHSAVVDGRRWLTRMLGRGVGRFGKAPGLWRPVAKTSLKFLSQP